LGLLAELKALWLWLVAWAMGLLCGFALLFLGWLLWWRAMPC
jgi:hypothetical protein